jgi:hypothetical protein
MKRFQATAPFQDSWSICRRQVLNAERLDITGVGFKTSNTAYGMKCIANGDICVLSTKGNEIASVSM